MARGAGFVTSRPEKPKQGFAAKPADALRAAPARLPANQALLRGRTAPIVPADHADEREADRIADQVMTGRQSPERSRYETKLASGPAPKVHCDAAAGEVAAGYGAKAVTIGADIHLDTRHGGLASEGGRRTLVHETVHVTQPWGSPPVARREVIGDVRSQTITPVWVKRLTDLELQQESAIAAQALAQLKPGTLEYDALSANVSLMEEEAGLRGIELTGVTAYALLSVIQPLASDLRKQLADIVAARKLTISYTGTTFGDLYDGTLAWGVDQMAWTTTALGEATQLVALAKNGGPQSSALLKKAGTRYVASLIGAQCVAIWMTYVQAAATGLHYAVPISHEYVIRRLFEVRDKLQPTMTGLQSFDAAKVEAAAGAFPQLAKPFEADFQTFVQAFDKASQNYAKFMKAYLVFQLVLGAYAGFRMTAGMSGGGAPAVLSFPGIGSIGAGGVATGARIVISAEWLEMIRRLGMIGAISIGSANSLIGVAYPGGQAPVPSGAPVMLRATPSGTTTPGKGPDANKPTPYGDSRHKHTRVADHTLQEMKDAIADPAKATGDLRNLRTNIGNTSYGSQLSKEAADNYGALVKDALENGRRVSATRIEHVASQEIGINIINGQGTSGYAMHWSSGYGGWHVFPF